MMLSLEVDREILKVKKSGDVLRSFKIKEIDMKRNKISYLLSITIFLC